MAGNKNCRTCKHMIFDERWGEYKCCHLCRRIYEIETNCPEYKENKDGEIKFTKENETDE